MLHAYKKLNYRGLTTVIRKVEQFILNAIKTPNLKLRLPQKRHDNLCEKEN